MWTQSSWLPSCACYITPHSLPSLEWSSTCTQVESLKSKQNLTGAGVGSKGQQEHLHQSQQFRKRPEEQGWPAVENPPPFPPLHWVKSLRKHKAAPVCTKLKALAVSTQKRRESGAQAGRSSFPWSSCLATVPGFLSLLQKYLAYYYWLSTQEVLTMICILTQK